MNEVEKFASESAIKLLIGNKCDLADKRKISKEEAENLAAQYNIKYIETSAKDSTNVSEAFKVLAREIKSKVMPKKKTGLTSTPASTPTIGIL